MYPPATAFHIPTIRACPFCGIFPEFPASFGADNSRSCVSARHCRVYIAELYAILYIFKTEPYNKRAGGIRYAKRPDGRAPETGTEIAGCRRLLPAACRPSRPAFLRLIGRRKSIILLKDGAQIVRLSVPSEMGSWPRPVSSANAPVPTSSRHRERTRAKIRFIQVAPFKNLLKRYGRIVGHFRNFVNAFSKIIYFKPNFIFCHQFVVRSLHQFPNPPPNFSLFMYNAATIFCSPTIRANAISRFCPNFPVSLRRNRPNNAPRSPLSPQMRR